MFPCMGCSCGILTSDHSMQNLALHSRFMTVESRLQILETVFHLQGPRDLNARFSRIEARLAKLEAQYGLRQAQHELAASAQASQYAGSAVSGMQHCLTQELQQRGVSGFKFVRVPGDYYEQPLEFRSASWQHHLKTHDDQQARLLAAGETAWAQSASSISANPSSCR